MSFALLSVPFLLVGLVIAAIAWPRRAPGDGVGLAIGLVALVALTAVFDNVMIGVGLFSYAEETLLGLRIGYAPIEDFGYPIVATLCVWSLWILVGGKERRP